MIKFLFGWAVRPGAPWWAYIIVAATYIVAIAGIVGCIWLWWPSIRRLLRRQMTEQGWLQHVMFEKGDYVRWNDPVEIGLERAGVCVQPTLTTARIPQWAVGIIPKFLWFIFDIRPIVEQEILGDDGKMYVVPERELWPTEKGEGK